MYLVGSAQVGIHEAALEAGWRVTPSSTDDPRRIVLLAEYRRGARDYVKIRYRQDGRFHNASTPGLNLPTVQRVKEYLAKPFKGNTAPEPTAPDEPYVVAVWGLPARFADQMQARRFAATAAESGRDMVEEFVWKSGAYIRTAVANPQ